MADQSPHGKPAIIIPHGLAAEVLRALQDGPRTAGQIVDAIDLARGRSEEEPGVGLAPVWRALCDLQGIGAITRNGIDLLMPCTWALRRTAPVDFVALEFRRASAPCPDRDESASTAPTSVGRPASCDGLGTRATANVPSPGAWSL